MSPTPILRVLTFALTSAPMIKNVPTKTSSSASNTYGLAPTARL